MACFHCEVTTPSNDNRMTLLVRCRFCERKQVPFLNVEMRDTKSSVTGNRSDRHSLAEDTKTFSCSQNDANRLVNNQVPFLSLHHHQYRQHKIIFVSKACVTFSSNSASTSFLN